MLSENMINWIIDSLLQSDEFDTEIEMVNTISFLIMFFEEFDFQNYIDNHNISKDEYKRYFRWYVKSKTPSLHKKIKKYYKGE